MERSTAMTTEEMIRRAVNVLSCAPGTVNAKMAFLRAKGCDDQIIMEALNRASGGALVEAARPEP